MPCDEYYYRRFSKKGRDGGPHTADHQDAYTAKEEGAEEAIERQFTVKKVIRFLSRFASSE
ncbi:MAG: hypothetical protein ACE5HN_00350 [Nitrospiria bacterium]